MSDDDRLAYFERIKNAGSDTAHLQMLVIIVGLIEDFASMNVVVDRRWLEATLVENGV